MFSVSPIKAFRDNYIWLITLADNQALVVDPGDAAPVIAVLEERALTLKGILLTHHHSDHAGGIAALKARAAGMAQSLTVYGPTQSKHSDHGCQDGERIAIPLADNSSLGDSKPGDTAADTLTLQVLEVPGHTLDHLAFVIDDALFCGDTLFSGGCGRLFEGTACELYQSLQKFAALPDTTRVFCAHEYTAANLKFALAAEPDNAALTEYAAEVDKLCAMGIPSLPSTLGRERAINPFLRTNSPTIRHSVGDRFQKTIDSDLECFTLLRQWKDNF
ncbi:hydroxyacylglutathione hydrolase [Shewanella sp. JM162201]|uniref:Hydroxyacylglutathione hydrolase n=1 Tax=Shewanella jiangmenensis TaxID=2837387 RepID=A0ABS5V6D5_9GAMM|nr:hydroxyacylglutathione hydrolase [Shewanella jiangmenensis]MBT1445998.1 hydroxyacylglutathione hydrolase [Shewanella jiangmenensis]